MLYFKYKKFIKIFKTIQKANNTENLEWSLTNRYGAVAKEAISILEAKGGIQRHQMSFGFYKTTPKIDAIILEYKDKCSSMFWGCVKWVIGTIIAVIGLYFAYKSFVA